MAGKTDKKLTKKDMYNKKILDTLSDKQIMDNLIRLKLVDPKAQGFKMGGMAKKKPTAKKKATAYMYGGMTKKKAKK